MKQEKIIEPKINQFEFIITPLQLTFTRTEAQTYAFQFCRGAQVYKKFDETIWVHDGEKTFKLTNNQEVHLKLQSEKGCKCQWSIYKIDDYDNKQYLTSVPVDIVKYYNNYSTLLKKDVKKYSTLFSTSQQGLSIQKQWTEVKRKLPYCLESQSSTNSEGISVLFNLEIKGQLDYISEEQHKMKMLKKKSRGSSKLVNQNESRSFIQDQSLIKHDSKHNIEQNQAKSPQPLISIVSPILKKNQTLSDIIQASNQCSSLNHQEKEHKIHPQIEEIPQEKQEQSPMLPPTTKTHNFQTMDIKLEGIDFDKKRSRTLREESNTDKKQNFMQLQTAPQSEITQPSKLSSPEKKTSSSVTMKLVVILLLVIGLSSLYLLDFREIRTGGVMKFMKNMVVPGKMSKKDSQKLKKGSYYDSKANSKRKQFEIRTQQEDEQKITRKGKTFETSDKKGKALKKNDKNKGKLLSDISDWIFSKINFQISDYESPKRNPSKPRKAPIKK